jgi:hypothetical protein
MKLPQSLQRYRGGMPTEADDGAIVKMRVLKAAIAWVMERIPSASAGLSVQRGKDGDVWMVPGQTSSAGGTVAANGAVSPFYVGNAMPVIGGDRIDGSYTPLEIGAGTVYVVMTIAGTLTKLGGVFVQNIVIEQGDVTIDVTDTEPGPDDLISTSGTYSVVLATFSDGAKIYQARVGDWYLDVIDDRTGAGQASLVRVYQ